MDSKWELFFWRKIHPLWYWPPRATAAPVLPSPRTAGDPQHWCLEHLHPILHVWPWCAQDHFLCLLFSSPSPLCFLAFWLFKNILPQNDHQLGWRAQLCFPWLPYVSIGTSHILLPAAPALGSHRSTAPNPPLVIFKITFSVYPRWLHVPSYLIMNLKLIIK